MYIAPYYSIEPHTTVIAHDDFAHHSGIVCQKTIIAIRGCMPSRVLSKAIEQ
jgi:hypothetical protein